MSLLRSWLWGVGVPFLLVSMTSPMASANNGDVQTTLSTETAPTEKILSRHRRYLVFPEGSTFTAACCMTAKTYVIKDKDIYSWGFAWGISYDLPNNSREIASIGAGIGPDGLRRQSQRGRRDRRDLYRKFEIAGNAAGIDGKACVLRAVCEARDLPGEKEKTPKSLPLELLRTVLKDGSAPAVNYIDNTHDILVAGIAYSIVVRGEYYKTN